MAPRKSRKQAVVGDDRPDFDPAVADQLTLQKLQQALQNLQTNGAAARNQLQAAAMALTTGVQQNMLAAVERLKQLSPLAAAAVEQLQKAQEPARTAALNAAQHVPADR